MITYKIHLIRNGRTAQQEEMRYVGRQDIPLCLEGAEELEHLRRECEYPRVQAVFTSPLQRCTETADILYPDVYTEQVEGLADMGLGRFEGRTFEQLRGDPDFAAWLDNSIQNPPPGGEHPEDFTRRIITAVRDIFAQMMEQRLQSVAVITHGGVIMSLLAGICLPKRPMREWAVAHGAGYTLLFTPQMWMRDGCAEVFAPLPENIFGTEQGIDDEKDGYTTWI